MKTATQLIALLIASSTFAASAHAEDCTPKAAMDKVYGLLKRFETGNTITNLYSNISNNQNSERDGKYVFLFTYDSSGEKKVVTAQVDAQTCALGGYSGSNVVAIDTGGKEI